MCGIVGCAGDGIQTVDLKVFHDLMRISTLRGVDGTGIFQGHFGKSTRNTFLIEKKAWEVSNFFRFHKTAQGNKLLLNSVMDNVFIGHTRWATTGPRNDDACHPYHVGGKNGIVGVHNGTMEDIKYISSTKTDSLMLYEDIQERGLKEVLESSDADSAYALSMLDMPTRTLYFVRNIERPLWVTFHKTRKVMYWASEPEFLKCAAGRHDLTIVDPTYFAINTIYSICLDDIDHARPTGQFTTEAIKPPTKKQVKTSHTNYMKNWDNIAWENANSNYPGRDTSPPFDNKDQGNSDSPKPTKAQRKELRRVRQEAARLVRLTNMRAISEANKKKNVSLSPVSLLDDHVSGDNGEPIFTRTMTQCPKIPTYACIGCEKEMKLIDQFFAEKIVTKEGDKLFECTECKQLASSVNTNVVHIN